MELPLPVVGQPFPSRTLEPEPSREPMSELDVKPRPAGRRMSHHHKHDHSHRNQCSSYDDRNCRTCPIRHNPWCNRLMSEPERPDSPSIHDLQSLLCTGSPHGPPSSAEAHEPFSSLCESHERSQDASPFRSRFVLLYKAQNAFRCVSRYRKPFWSLWHQRSRSLEF